MSDLDTAIALATKAHEGQTDKAGKPYIDHVLRVMNAVDTDEEKIVAVLHNLLEDTEYTANDLREMGFSDRVVSAIEALTRQKGETYRQFIDRVSLNPLAVRVKISDLKDNMDLSRIAEPTERDRLRTEKYAVALALLEE